MTNPTLSINNAEEQERSENPGRTCKDAHSTSSYASIQFCRLFSLFHLALFSYFALSLSLSLFMACAHPHAHAHTCSVFNIQHLALNWYKYLLQKNPFCTLLYYSHRLQISWHGQPLILLLLSSHFVIFCCCCCCSWRCLLYLFLSTCKSLWFKNTRYFHSLSRKCSGLSSSPFQDSSST